MKVRYSQTALRELDEIFAYIHERNPSAAVASSQRLPLWWPSSIALSGWPR